MKLLKCKICSGEVEIHNSGKSVLKKIKCKKCGFNNFKDFNKSAEIIVIKK